MPPSDKKSEFLSASQGLSGISFAHTKIPPQSLEAEMSVLGSLMLDRQGIFQVADSLAPSDFYKTIHRIIYETVLELFEKREPIDVLSVQNRLKERQELEAIGGSGYLTDLVNTVPTAGHLMYYAEIVRRKSLLRSLIDTAFEIGNLGYREDEDVDLILDEAEKRIFSIARKALKQEFISIKDELEHAWERIDSLHKGGDKLRGLSTGFTDLDDILAGLQKSDFIVLAARPSLGKTSFALDMARHIALKENTGVGIFSLEMSKEQVVDRLIAAQSHVELQKIRTGKYLTEDDFSRISQSLDLLSRAPVYIDDTVSANVLQMRAMARRLQAEHPLGIIIVDYLQLMEGRGKSDNRVQEVSEISRSLKGLARELNVPVLALSQLSRAAEIAPTQRPRLSHLRESGSIEQDADVVLFIWREDRAKEYVPDERKNIAEILVSKHRNGPLGTVELFFHETRASFSSFSKRDYS